MRIDGDSSGRHINVRYMYVSVRECSYAVNGRRTRRCVSDTPVLLCGRSEVPKVTRCCVIAKKRSNSIERGVEIDARPAPELGPVVGY